MHFQPRSEATDPFIIPSNSSFTACESQHSVKSTDVLYRELSYSKYSTNNKQVINSEDTLKPTPRQTPSGSASFTSCSFTSLSSTTSGGAIYLTQKDASLTIAMCSFTDCKAKKGSGGGIYANPAKEVIILESTFLRCNVISSNNGGEGGGCAYIYSVDQKVQIIYTSFISSSVPYDSGGIHMRSCNAPENTFITFQHCIFIACKGDDSDGGGIMAWGNNYNVGISNVLFCECSNKNGGAFVLSVLSSATTPFISFCLFYRNSATANGQDIYFNNCGTNPISHSFTTSSRMDRVYLAENSNAYQYNWLT